MSLPLLVSLVLLGAAPEAPSQTSAKSAGSTPEFSIPFGCGLSFPVSQAHDTGSHKHTDVWAWDFKMPEGVPITAAADGVVRLARGDSTVGGCGEEFAAHSNYIVLEHADRYETQYLHFQRLTVKAGDKVKAGDLIGYSGKTGWACGAHLHFKVTRATGRGWNNDSVPANFKGYGDPQVATLVSAVACQQPAGAMDGAPLVADAEGSEEQGAARTALGGQLPSGQQTVEQATGSGGGDVVPASARMPASSAARR